MIDVRVVEMNSKQMKLNDCNSWGRWGWEGGLDDDSLFSQQESENDLQ